MTYCSTMRPPRTHLQLARDAAETFGSLQAKLDLSLIHDDFAIDDPFDDRAYWAVQAAEGDREALDALIGELEAEAAYEKWADRNPDRAAWFTFQDWRDGMHRPAQSYEAPSPRLHGAFR